MLFNNRNIELEYKLRDMEKKIEELEKQLNNLPEPKEPDLSLIEHRLAELEAKEIPDVEKEGKSFFADKNVQKIVYGAVAMLLTAAGASFIGGVPWLG